MLMVVVLLPLSSSMYDGELDHGGVGGNGGGPAAAAAAAVVAVAAVAAVEENYRQKRLATRVLTVT